MKAKIIIFLNITAGVFCGEAVGILGYAYWGYKRNPEFFLARPMPWYAEALIIAVVLIVLSFILMLIRDILINQHPRLINTAFYILGITSTVLWTAVAINGMGVMWPVISSIATTALLMFKK